MAQPNRRLIAAPRITLDIEDDDDDDDLSDVPPSSPPLGSYLPQLVAGGSAPVSLRRPTSSASSVTHPPILQQEGLGGGVSGGFNQWGRMAYDLATYVSTAGVALHNRRHSICVCETPGSNSSPTHRPPSSIIAPSNPSQSDYYNSIQNGHHNPNQNGHHNPHQNGHHNPHQNGLHNPHQNGLHNPHQNGLHNRTQIGHNSAQNGFHNPSISVLEENSSVSSEDSEESLCPSSSSSSVSPSSLLVRWTNSSCTDALASHSQNQRDFLSSTHFASHLDCLSLTLEEVVHIRNVLTKADLETLPLDLSIKEDMAKGKICFLCMKVRFSFFGQWAVECRLCKRNVCKKCVSKMRIPTEHFGNIPVVMLTPQSFSPRDDEDDCPALLPRQLFSRLQELPSKSSSSHRRLTLTTSVGSAPSSPQVQLRSSEATPHSVPHQHHTPATPPYVHDDVKRKQEHRQQQRLQHGTASNTTTESVCKEQLRGQLMSVCRDCKAMVLHVLRSIRLLRDQHQRRLKTPSPLPNARHVFPPQRHSLHLNLTPVYN